jgi:hypothetical protein
MKGSAVEGDLFGYRHCTVHLSQTAKAFFLFLFMVNDQMRYDWRNTNNEKVHNG